MTDSTTGPEEGDGPHEREPRNLNNVPHPPNTGISYGKRYETGRAE